MGKSGGPWVGNGEFASSVVLCGLACGYSTPTVERGTYNGE